MGYNAACTATPPPELQSPCIVFAVLQSAHGLQQPGADVQVDHSESLL